MDIEKKKDWKKDFDRTFAIKPNEKYVTFGIDGLKEWIESSIKEAREEGYGKGYKDACKDCVDLADCETCQEEIDLQNTKQETGER